MQLREADNPDVREAPAPRVITPSDAADLYDEEYYRNYCGPLAYERSDHWIRFFGGIAEHLIRSLKPVRVLDAGCAMGFLVESFWDRGVEAWGVDISPYAIANVRRDMQPFCRTASLTDPIQETFDLITCIEVIEHMTEDDARAAIANLCSATGTILFSSSPNDFAQPTHFSVRPPFFWLKSFAEFGFYPDLGYDAGFVTPHAMLLRKNLEGMSDDVLALYAEHIRTRCLLHERQQSLSTLAGEHSELVRQNAAVLQAEEQAHAQIDSLTEQLESVTRQISELAEIRAGLERSNTRLQSELAEFANRFNNINREIEVAAAANDHFHAQISELLSAASADGEHMRRAAEQTVSQAHDVRARVDEVSLQLRDLAESRIWRTLRWAGGVMLAFGSLPQRFNRPRPGAPESDRVMLSCDEPTPDQPCTDRVRFRGWAIAKTGIDRVDIEIDEQPKRRAEYGLKRPDIARAHAQFKDAGRSEFLLEFDTAGMPAGSHAFLIRAFSRSGLAGEWRGSFVIPVPAFEQSEYETWIEDFEPPTPELLMRVAVLGSAARGSVILPVAKATPEQLQATVSSLKAQSYANWDLVIACASAANAAIEEIAHQDARIRVITSEGSPEAAANRAGTSVTDGFTLLMNAGDTLNPHAMFHLAEAFERSSETDLVYSDEDRLSREGKRQQPFFKPDFSPDLLLSKNYIGRLAAARNTLWEAVDKPWASELGNDVEYDEYDLVLRLAEKARKVTHIPQVLYHRAEGVTVPSSDTGRLAIQRHLARNGVSADLKPAVVPGSWRVCYAIPENLNVSIIIASGGKAGVLKTNLESLFAKTTYPHYEVVIIDNSAGDTIQSYCTSLHKHHENVRYIDWRNRPFNYSAINNAAARTCKNGILLFLNDDTSVIEPDWLTAMVELGARPEVGAVGSKLLYPDGRIQHAGVIMGVWDNCGHAFKGLPGAWPHYFGLSDVTRNVSAVTGACLMTRAEIFREVGGFDENNLRVAFNDIDLCLRIGAKGYRVLYTPHAVLCHHEAFSKTSKDIVPHPAEVAYMRTHWSEVIAADPYYSPNLARTAEDYSLRKKNAV